MMPPCFHTGIAAERCSGMALSQSEFLEFLTPSRRKYILECIQAGLATYKNEAAYGSEARRDHTAQVRATIRNCHIVAYAQRNALDHSDVVVVNCKNRVLFIIAGTVRVTFKMLSRGLRPGHAATHQARAYMLQQDIPVDPKQAAQFAFGFMPQQSEMTNLVAGYRLDALGEEEEVFIVCPAGDHNLWVLKLSGGELAQFATPEPIAPLAPRVSRRRVFPRKGSVEEGAAGGPQG